MKRRAHKPSARLACGLLMGLLAGLSALTWRVWRQDTAQVRLLLRYGANVQAKDQQGTALLTLAKRYHDTALIHTLEQAGAAP